MYPGTAHMHMQYPLLSQEQLKNFTFLVSIVNKSPLQISGKVAVVVPRLSKIFRASMYWAHREVIFVVAQLSCSYNELMWCDYVHTGAVVTERVTSSRGC